MSQSNSPKTSSLARRVITSERMLNQVMRGLYSVARRTRPANMSRQIERVVHISPAYFSEKSYVGGGERYVISLAEAMAEHVETVMVSFGDRRDRFRQGRLTVEIYPLLQWLRGQTFDPLNYGFLSELTRADTIHCHHFRLAVSNLGIVGARALGKRVFVTDLGGEGCHFTNQYPLADIVTGFLPISEFAAQLLPGGKAGTVIYGGVDRRFEAWEELPRKRQALFVGRLLPHKGINYLIEGINKNISLELIGRPYNEEYFALLRHLAEGKKIEFVNDATDKQLIQAYRESLVTVLPSVYKDVYGTQYIMPELLGLVMLESMACGTSVICTNVGAMPEFVEDGVTGFIVPPNDPSALSERVSFLVNNPDIALRMGKTGRERVLRKYTWDAVAQRCLQAYMGN